ncbi:MaoC/PaaZ C-terminal domain-containing protein [Alicyclobacillus sp. ALC3]|uniref:MaoC/PaaZ C-terminal domain-containing protein n=1 Tax=Alicyclobacillus sp. ALC3 TaxID=2796143 RepID=UPI002379421D|nr:MaoC/PaaZ C-terminal domain-containing protein [Alicyclobacillus sp. ALC3]WDL99323.1 MaoC family dehydratase N-terminal domain-containing protein [Alicyclobacillus sp. ALC3]
MERYQPGQALGPLVKPPVTKTQLVMYSGASGDFNPIHTVDEFAQQAGLGGVIAHGMLTMAFVGQMLSEIVGVEGDLLTFGIRFTGMVRPGDVVTCAGTVKAVEDVDGQQVVRADVWGMTQKQERVVAGHAEFAVALR